MMKAKVGSRERAGFFTYAFAILMVMAALGPFVYVVLTALKSPEQIYNAEEIIPSYITFSNFTGVLTRSLFVRYFLNSVYITLVTMSISMVMAVLAAYGFTRYHIFGANTMKTTILMTRMFPGILLCLPFYIIMKNLGLIDSHLGLILMYLSFTLPFAIWNLCCIFRTDAVGAGRSRYDRRLCQIFRFLPSDDPCGKARPFCNSFVQFYEQLGRVHVCDDLY